MKNLLFLFLLLISGPAFGANCVIKYGIDQFELVPDSTKEITLINSEENLRYKVRVFRCPRLQETYRFQLRPLERRSPRVCRDDQLIIYDEADNVLNNCRIWSIHRL